MKSLQECSIRKRANSLARVTRIWSRLGPLFPEGTYDNSPTFQRWVLCWLGQVPKGRLIPLLKWSLRAFAALCLGSIFATGNGCAPGPHSAAPLTRFEYNQPEMGVPFRIVLYATNSAAAEDAAKTAFDRIRRLNELMSDYEPDSELTLLSQTAGQGKAVKVSDELWTVLSRAQKLSAESGGAFDVTVGPYVLLWRKARREHKMPDPTALAAARAAVGYTKVQLDPARHTVQLRAPGMRLDLGGIAKGYALDEAMKALRAHGIRSALVSGGGDLLVSEPPPEKSGWRIELPPLDASNAPPGKFVLLRNAALSTSGDLYQRLEIDGKRYSHIVDPRTGIGLTDHSLVTIIAPDGITSDSLTKVASILGRDEALKFMEKQRGVALRVVRKPGEKIEVFESSNFKSNLPVTD